MLIRYVYVRHVINTLRIRPELENYIESSAYASVFAKFSYVVHTLAKSSRCDSAFTFFLGTPHGFALATGKSLFNNRSLQLFFQKVTGLVFSLVEVSLVKKISRTTF